MHTPIRPRRLLLLIPTLALPFVATAQSPPLPPGLLNFAGHLAHNHWHLFGETRRPELDALNRELREADQEISKARDESARRIASNRGWRAVERLRAILEDSPRLLRLDLTNSPEAQLPAAPLLQPGDTGALLFEVKSGGDGLSFTVGGADLAQPGGESSRVSLDVGERGVTYVVAGLEHLPFGRTMLRLELNLPGRSPLRLPLEVATPQPGRLKLTVLSDDTGEPTPAMVRLMWRTDGLERRPANAIEFAPQFDGQGHATGVRAANLPGPLSAHFWCVPGPFDMALSPGVWQIGVRRGVEHEVIFDDITLAAGKTVERTLRPRRWTDQRRRGWWSGDDHVHARILSDDDARNVLAWVKAEEVHLANIVKMGDIYRTYFEQRGFGSAHRVLDGEYVLVPGQECPRTHDQLGHTLAMNITSMVRDPENYFLYDTVFDAVHAQGGLSGYAHVNSGLFHVHRDMTLNVPRARVDFAEILQFNHLGTDLYYEFLNLGCKLTASAGSDVPWGGTIGEVRAYAYLGGLPFTPDNWFAAFARGRTFTTSGPMLEFRVDETLPGDELRVRDNRTLRIRASAWGDPRRMGAVTLEIVRHGQVLRTARSTDPAHPKADLDFTVDSANGFWIAARARAADGTSAHTTPVYVIREGLRFWNHDGLEELLVKREESLRQIEELIAQARQPNSEDRLDRDRYHLLLAQQGDALLERVAQARNLFADLRRVAQAESAQRALASP